MQLRVLENVGCGMILQPTKWGMVVEAVFLHLFPALKAGGGQQAWTAPAASGRRHHGGSHLGSIHGVPQVDKISLVGLPEDACEDTFGASFKHGAWLCALSGSEVRISWSFAWGAGGCRPEGPGCCPSLRGVTCS